VAEKDIPFLKGFGERILERLQVDEIAYRDFSEADINDKPETNPSNHSRRGPRP
jgi:hypothetical protein